MSRRNITTTVLKQLLSKEPKNFKNSTNIKTNNVAMIIKFIIIVY